MKIFQASQKNLSYVGISQYWSLQQNPANGRNMTAFAVLSVCSVMNCMFLFYDASTFIEYASGVFACSAIIDGTVIFVCIVCRMRSFFECVNRIEQSVNESEFFDPILTVNGIPKLMTFIFRISVYYIKGDVRKTKFDV